MDSLSIKAYRLREKGMSYKDIAEVLGITPTSAKQRYLYIKRKIESGDNRLARQIVDQDAREIRRELMEKFGAHPGTFVPQDDDYYYY